MNSFRFQELVINLDQVCFFQCGKYDGKPSIDFTFPTPRKSDPMEPVVMSPWFSREKYRDAAFELLCDKMGATNLIDRCEVTTKPTLDSQK